MPEQRNIHYCSDDAENTGKCIGSFKRDKRDVAQYTVCLWYEFLDCVLLEMSQTIYDIILRSHNIKNIYINYYI